MYETVPQELKSLPNWVGWKLETRDGKPTKVPYSRTGIRAAATNPQDWRNFNDVCNIISSKEKGIGFVFDGNGIVGIDLDYCFNLDGTIKHEFTNVISTLKSYTEISPSGGGLHIFIKCKEHPYYWRDEPTKEFPEGKEHFGKKKNGLEIYSKQRYFTITGMKWNGCPLDIIEYPVDIIRKVCNPILEISDKPQDIIPFVPMSTCLSDEDILKIASRASNAHKFNNLWSGSKSEYNDDDSAADMALASMLAFYSTDANQIERLMRQSGLKRAKWDNHKTYLKSMTIQKAIRDCRVHYEPKNDGSVEEGKEISKQFLNTPTKNNTKKVNKIVETYQEKSDDANEKVKEAIKEASIINLLPEFPQTNHPLFKKWMEIGSEISYSRVTFHYFTLLTVLSMALGRTVKTKVGLNDIYPNVYCMLLGTSSISGKSYAMEMARRFLNIIISSPYGVNQENKIIVTTDKISEPRLVQDLSHNSNMYWEYDECQAFFKGVEKYNAPILPQLCKIYDGSSVSSRLSRASAKKDDAVFEWVCKTPFLSCLFAMTTDQFDRLANSEYLEGGFLPRVMFPLEEGGAVTENVDITEEQEKEIDLLSAEIAYVAEKLRCLKHDSISFYVSKKIEQWKVSKTNEFCGPDEVNKRIAIQRSFIHAYKIAMILSIYDKEFQKEIFDKEYPIKINIPEKWVDEALTITEKYLFPRTVYVLDRANEENVRNNITSVKRAIQKNGGSIDKAKLIRSVRILKEDLDKVINTMIESNEIEVYYHTAPGANKSTTTYCLKKI